jgi:hypothetical protein
VPPTATKPPPPPSLPPPPVERGGGGGGGGVRFELPGVPHFDQINRVRFYLDWDDGDKEKRCWEPRWCVVEEIGWRQTPSGEEEEEGVVAGRGVGGGIGGVGACGDGGACGGGACGGPWPVLRRWGNRDFVMPGGGTAQVRRRRLPLSVPVVQEEVEEEEEPVPPPPPPPPPLVEARPCFFVGLALKKLLMFPA